MLSCIIRARPRSPPRRRAHDLARGIPMNAKPNILFILTDQHAPKVSGFAGDPVVRTPHLDDLASRSVQFETAS